MQKYVYDVKYLNCWKNRIQKNIFFTKTSYKQIFWSIKKG